MTFIARVFLFLFLIFASYSSHAQRSWELNLIDEDKDWTYNFQFTGVYQNHPPFHAAYSGKNSQNNAQQAGLTVTSTLFVGRRLWKDATIFYNPEVAGGNGIGSALGIAAFTNGEAFRIGNPAPAFYTARLFFRQHFHLKGDYEEKEEGINQLSENVPRNRLVFTVGKISLADVFDNNNVSHDPRSDFMNWSFMSNGAWDYSANTRGYTDAFVAEYYKSRWAFRGAVSLNSRRVNGPVIDWNIHRQYSLTFELEHYHYLGSSKRKGIVRLLGYRNKTRAGYYSDAVNLFRESGDSSALDVYNTEDSRGIKYGMGLNLEQQITEDLSCFARAGWNNGKSATWMFTEIDQTLSGGLRMFGRKWKRPGDNVGIAFLSNGISGPHRNYLASGGNGFMIGDGRLRYGRETAAELFYQAQIAHSLFLSLDYQFVSRPGYNRDRGPIHVFGVRVHFGFK